MGGSIFSQIIRGDIPSYKVYEDDKTYAFLDINPVNPGHTLVVPKTEVDHLWDLPDDDYQALMAATKKIANHMRKILGCPRVGVMVEGFEVPHAHIHLLPITMGLNHELAKPKTSQNSEAELKAMAEQLYFA